MKRYWEFQHQRVNSLPYFTILKKKNSEKKYLLNMGEGEGVASTLTSIPFARPLVKCERGVLHMNITVAILQSVINSLHYT